MNRENDNRAKSDCDAALCDALYREHHRVLHAYLFGQFAHSETAADLLQETFVRVWRHIGEARRVPTEKR